MERESGHVTNLMTQNESDRGSSPWLGSALGSGGEGRPSRRAIYFALCPSLSSSLNVRRSTPIPGTNRCGAAQLSSHLLRAVVQVEREGRRPTFKTEPPRLLRAMASTLVGSLLLVAMASTLFVETQEPPRWDFHRQRSMA